MDRRYKQYSMISQFYQAAHSGFGNTINLPIIGLTGGPPIPISGGGGIPRGPPGATPGGGPPAGPDSKTIAIIIVRQNIWACQINEMLTAAPPKTG